MSIRKTLLLLLVASLTFPLALAGADNCFVDCMNVSGCWSSRSDENVSYCSGTEARCETECRDSVQPRSYGAIAYSPKDEAYGYSHSWDNRNQAEKLALENCKQHGSGCEIEVWFYNSCGAVAADVGVVSWGQDSLAQEAKNIALNKCKSAGGKNCEIKVSHCSP